MNTLDTRHIDAIVDKYGAKSEALITIMHEIQQSMGCISQQAASHLSKRLEIPASQIFSAASYYKAFSIDKKGRHQIKVCTGTSCHLRRGSKVLERLGRELKIDGEGTSEDLQFTLEKVRCMGCCDAGPVIKVNNTLYGNTTQRKALNLIKQYRENS